MFVKAPKIEKDADIFHSRKPEILITGKALKEATYLTAEILTKP
jgi:hypothetical protein